MKKMREPSRISFEKFNKSINAGKVMFSERQTQKE